MWQETMAWWKQITFQLNTGRTVRQPGFTAIISESRVSAEHTRASAQQPVCPQEPALEKELEGAPDTITCGIFGTHPIRPTVALSRHSSQLGIQQVPGFVDALREKQETPGLELWTWGLGVVLLFSDFPLSYRIYLSHLNSSDEEKNSPKKGRNSSAVLNG